MYGRSSTSNPLVANPEGIRDDAAQAAGGSEMAEGGGDEKASGTTPSVFISYASQDAAVAAALVEALERHGIPCWIAPRDVKPGAQYADAIVRAINEAKAVVLVLSGSAVSSSHVAREVERAASKHKPIIAFRIDSAPLVPALEYFLSESQWIDVVKLGMPAALAKLSEAVGQGSGLTVAATSVAHPKSSRDRILFAAGVAVVAVALAALWADKVWISKRVPASQPVASAAPQSTGAASSTPATEAAFTPPPHSIAVLPFVNMSGDASQEYFSDGLTEELLNSLSRINELQVAARTSAFSFKGKDTDIGTIARKLNVGAVLEGSVRRSAHTVRITAQLINAVTGFHLWSQTYDRNLGDILALQTEIANAVASALKVTLLGDEAAKIEVGGTHNAAAFDAHLRTLQAYWKVRNAKESQGVLAGFTEAIRLDPDYAVSYADRSIALVAFATQWAVTASAVRIALDKALADARKAVALAPNLGEGHLALAVVYSALREFTPALEEYERALALAPGNVRVLRDYGAFAVNMGRTDSGLKSIRRAAELDPLNANSYTYLGAALLALRRYEQAIAAYTKALAVGGDPGPAAIGEAYYLLGDLQSARTSCEENARETVDVQSCLALTYDKLGRHADAEAELAKIKATAGDTGAYGYAAIYAQWGRTAKALEWLETALRLRDPSLQSLKTEPLLDPLRKEPRFQAIERELKFPT
jgi:serine/threonine-protein kinase